MVATLILLAQLETPPRFDYERSRVQAEQQMQDMDRGREQFERDYDRMRDEMQHREVMRELEQDQRERER
jgi:hypothetical protein